MKEENKLHADLTRLLCELRQMHQESEERWKKYNKDDSMYLEPGGIYLEGVYSGEKYGYNIAARLLESILIYHDVTRGEACDGETRL